MAGHVTFGQSITFGFKSGTYCENVNEKLRVEVLDIELFIALPSYMSYTLLFLH